MRIPLPIPLVLTGILLLGSMAGAQDRPPRLVAPAVDAPAAGSGAVRTVAPGRPGTPPRGERRPAGGPTIRLADHGARCDGTADDTAAFRAFFAAVNKAAAGGNGATGIVSGRCRVTSVGAVLASGVAITGEPGAVIDCIGDKGWCIAFAGGGNAPAKLKPAAPVARNADRITLTDAKSLAAGDWVHIEYFPTNNPVHSAQGQLNRVTGKAGNEITLAHPVTFAMARPAFATVLATRLASGVRIAGLTFSGAGASGTAHGVLIENFAGAEISDLRAVDFTSYDRTGKGQQRGIHINACDDCSIARIAAERVSGWSIFFSRMTGASVTGVRVARAGGAGLEFVYTSLSSFADIEVDGSRGRAAKLYGATASEFVDVRLRASLGERFPDGTWQNYTGFSVSSASSDNLVRDLRVTQASSCVWLNGTGNDRNVFERVRVGECQRPDPRTGAPLAGTSIMVWATAPTRDTDNVFRAVHPSARARIADTGARTSIDYTGD